MEEKQKLFNADLEPFLELRRQKNYQVPTDRMVDIKEQQPPEPQLSDDVVVDPIPKTMRPRATALLNRLKTRPDVITWDKTGQVKIKGEAMARNTRHLSVCAHALSQWIKLQRMRTKVLKSIWRILSVWRGWCLRLWICTHFPMETVDCVDFYAVTCFQRVHLFHHLFAVMSFRTRLLPRGNLLRDIPLN